MKEYILSRSHWASSALLVALLTGCGGGSEDSTEAGTLRFTGAISGLNGELTLSINGDQQLLDVNGSFQSENRYTIDSDYSLSLLNVPSHQSCSLNATSGVVSSAMPLIEITCTGGTPQAFSLSSLAFNVEQPSVLTYAFHLVDRMTGEAVTDITEDNLLNYIKIEENGAVLSESLRELEQFDNVSTEYHTVFAIDINEFAGEDSSQVIDAIKQVIIDGNGQSKLADNQFVTILTFATNVTAIVTKERNIDTITAALEAVEFEGFSRNLFGAIIDGANVWQNDIGLDKLEYGHLVVFTSGNDVASSASISDAVEATEDKDVYFISLGDEVDTETLSQITPSNRIFTVEDISTLAAALDQALATIQTFKDGLYVLSYATPKRGGDHTLTIHAVDDYRCDTAVNDAEQAILDNNGSLNCNDSAEFDFDADGFTDVEPVLVLSGPRTILSDEVAVKANMKWVRAEPTYEWNYRVCVGEGSVTLDANNSGLMINRSSTGALVGVQVTATLSDQTEYDETAYIYMAETVAELNALLRLYPVNNTAALQNACL